MSQGSKNLYAAINVSSEGISDSMVQPQMDQDRFRNISNLDLGLDIRLH